jgi:type IV pilus assembly protein PilM
MVIALRKRRSAVTLDLGSGGTRVCQLAAGRGDLLRLEQLPHDDDTLAVSDVSAGQFRRWLGQGRFCGDHVSLVLSPPEVHFFPLRLPAQALQQPAERVEQALKWEVAQQSRSSPDQFELRYWTLPEGRGPSANVMAVVLPTPAAQRLCDQVERDGLSLRRVDVAPCALVRLARRLWTPAEHDVWGVLDLGLRQATLTVVVGTTPTYVRPVSVSAHQWTQRIASTFDVAYPVAEQIKREHGVGTHAGADETPAPPDAQGEDLARVCGAVLRDDLRALAQECARCFAYVLQGYPDHEPRQLFLAGGGGRLNGLPEALSQSLDMPVRPLDNRGTEGLSWAEPLTEVRVEPQTALVVGAALLDLEAS